MGTDEGEELARGEWLSNHACKAGHWTSKRVVYRFSCVAGCNTFHCLNALLLHSWLYLYNSCYDKRDTFFDSYDLKFIGRDFDSHTSSQ